MPGSYPAELRVRVVRFVQEGESRHQAAEHFAVSVSSAIRWMQRFRDSGTCEAMPRGGSTSPLEKHAKRILALINEQRDVTLDELVLVLHKRGIGGSRSALSRFFARHGLTFKKKSAGGRAKASRRGSGAPSLLREQGLLDPARLVFIDETAVTTNMVRLNGWKARGERLVDDVPMGKWETLTFIAGLRQTGIIAPMVIKGPMNGEAFLAYIEQCLVPKLKRRDIVVIDNVSFHKVAGVVEAIQAARAELRYLPQYSPELNPIELVFHPLKALLRKAAERTIEGLERSVGSFIRARAPSEFMGYFRHAGYEP